MWGKAKIDEEETAKAVRNRLITVLGLEQSEAKEDPYPLTPYSKSEPVIAESEASATSFHSILDLQTETDDGFIGVPETLCEPRSDNGASSREQHLFGATTCVQEEDLFHAATGGESDSAGAGELRSTVDAALTELTQKSEELVEKQTRQFQESLAQIGTKTLTQAEATVRRTVSRLENCVAEAHQAELTMDESLTNLARRMTEAAHGQIHGLEENLAKITGQIGSRMQTDLEPVARRVETYRAQIQEMSSTLDGALTRFTQKAEEAARTRAELFDEKIVAISEQAVSQTQEGVRSCLAQLGEVAAQSLEKQIASMGETVERRLKENFEAWSKAQLEIIQQQAGKFSSDLLTQARAEAESIAEQVQTRLKSDAQTLETRTVEAMHGRLGKIADEFRSILERAFA